FTPNGDMINDVFYIPGICPAENYSLLIYDRWGILVFSATERNHAWDGRTTSGNIATDGVYYFIVNVAGTAYKGFLELIR
ncbi:MAG: T9SS type B sorting domain-containing protein, partial [Bacteroidia bacterium]